MARGRLAGLGVAASLVLSAGLLTGPAGPAVAAVGPGVTYSSGGTGYLVSGRFFRYLRTEVQLPTNAVCAQLYPVLHTSAGEGSFSVTVELGSSAAVSIAAVLTDVPTSTGCGTFAGKAVDNGSTFSAPAGSVSAGDTVAVSVYYDPAGAPTEHAVSITVNDLTSENGFFDHTSNDHGSTYTTAQASVSFSSFTAPAAQFRPFAFTGSQATTYTGNRGTLTGPWTTSQIVRTSNGRSTGTVQASSPVLWDGGSNFSSWIRTG